VLGHHAEPLELRLEADLAAPRRPDEDRPVVGEQAGRRPVGLDRGQEGAYDVAALDRPEGVGGEAQPGVVVDQVEDLDVAPVS
jgi:hypothetical protein